MPGVGLDHFLKSLPVFQLYIAQIIVDWTAEIKIMSLFVLEWVCLGRNRKGFFK